MSELVKHVACSKPSCGQHCSVCPRGALCTIKQGSTRSDLPMVLQVVNEWTFQKDGVDVEMRDISNDTKSAQLDSRDTFLGVGQNRYKLVCCPSRVYCHSGRASMMCWSDSLAWHASEGQSSCRGRVTARHCRHLQAWPLAELSLSLAAAGFEIVGSLAMAVLFSAPISARCPRPLP